MFTSQRFFFGKWSSYFLSHRIHEKIVCLPTFFTETYGKNVGKSIQFLTHGWVNTLEVLQLRSPRLPQVLEDLGGQGWSVFLLNFDADVFPPRKLTRQWKKYMFFFNRRYWRYRPPKLTARPWKWMVGILRSFWETLFSGAMLVSGRVHLQMSSEENHSCNK